jgi:ribose 5-phosphate isomerase B
MRVAVGADHHGHALKEVVKRHLVELGHDVSDLGTHSTDPVDYPDVAERVAREVAAGAVERAVLVCGTGIGMAITANKVPGVFAAVAHDPYSAARARMSNDAQVVTMGARVIAPELAKTVLRVWLDSEFAGGGSARKVDKIRTAERALRDEQAEQAG